MVEIDRVLPPIFVRFEGNLDINELYHLIKDFLEEKKYDVDEKEYSYSDKNNLKIKFEGDKKINDYTSFTLKATIKGSKIKKIKLKKKDAFLGKFEVKIQAFVNKDYQDYYESKPVIKFFRELFDHTVKKQEFSVMGSHLKSEGYALFDEVKAYLGLQKLQ